MRAGPRTAWRPSRPRAAPFGLDPPLELLVQPLDRIGGPGRLPLRGRQPRERKQRLARLLQAVGYCRVTQPPLAEKGLAALLNLLGCRRIDHVGVIGRDLVLSR